MTKHRHALLAGVAVLSLWTLAAGAMEVDQPMQQHQDHPAWDQLSGLGGLEDTVIVNFMETELGKICESLGAVGQIEMAFNGNFQRHVTLDTGRTTLGEALVRLAADQGLHYSVEAPGKLAIHAPFMPGMDGVVPARRLEGFMVQPEYPEQARQDMIEGMVVMEVILGADGSVSSMTILREVPEEYGLAEAAMDAVGQWRYEPAARDGVPVDSWLTIAVQFSLD